MSRPRRKVPSPPCLLHTGWAGRIQDFQTFGFSLCLPSAVGGGVSWTSASTSECQKSKRTSTAKTHMGEMSSAVPMWASWTNRGVDPQKEKLREAGKEYPSVQSTPSKRKGPALFSPLIVDRIRNHGQKGRISWVLGHSFKSKNSDWRFLRVD